MDENLNNRQKELLHNLLANPADTGSAYAADLKEMVTAYPQSGLLRALYGRALSEKDPALAGAYFDGAALHKLFFHADSLLPVPQEQVVLQAGYTSTTASAAPPVPEKPAVEYTPTEPVFYQKDDNSDILTDQPPGFPDVLNVSWLTNPEEEFAANIHQTEQLQGAESEPADIEEEQETVAEESVKQESDPIVTELEEEDFTWPPVVSDEPVAAEEALIEHPEELQSVVSDEPVAPEESLIEQAEEPQQIISDEPVAPEASLIEQVEEPQPVIEPEDVPIALPPITPQQESPIEDEVFEEITGIDDIEFVQTPADVSVGPVAGEEALIEPAQPTAETQEVTPATADEAEKLMLGNIAATDYFVFDRAFGDNKKPAEETPQPAQTSVVAKPAEPFVEENTAHQDISKYHDEKMPYTFMWWLDKTRKEHGNLYQPYTKAPVGSPVRKPEPNELQQQYLENIFHITSIDELNSDAAKTVEFDMQSKGDRIIQRFITEDPHIHPPVGEKLDTENKAKKSSEDNDQMVTETLAQIYADQMLYPKAIATYQKLMLKFPEKSRYFASRIQNLEKKTN